MNFIEQFTKDDMQIYPTLDLGLTSPQQDDGSSKERLSELVINSSFVDSRIEEIRCIYERELTTLLGVKLHISIERHEIRISSYDDVHLIAVVCVMEMFNCCGCAVSTGKWVTSNWRNKGLGTVLTCMAIDIARAKRYSFILATDSSLDNIRILTRLGFYELDAFVNKNSSFTVRILGREL